MTDQEKETFKRLLEAAIDMYEHLALIGKARQPEWIIRWGSSIAQAEEMLKS